jgi:DedD protein
VLSFLKRKDTSPAASAVDEAASVQAARTRARRRLIGAAVLVGVGIIGFPLLFETQPRPIAVDIPIEIPSREGTPPLGPPVPKAGTRPVPKPSAPVVAERAAEAPIEPAPPPPAPAAPTASSVALPPVAASTPPRAERATTAAEPAPASRVVVPATAAANDAQRAQALLDGSPATPSAASAPGAAASESKGGRFVVQAGAYTDATALREARQKVERLGMKTYTQVIETESGARTRVRVGPFATREEADKAAARIKGSGLATSILSL